MNYFFVNLNNLIINFYSSYNIFVNIYVSIFILFNIKQKSNKSYNLLKCIFGGERNNLTIFALINFTK